MAVASNVNKSLKNPKYIEELKADRARLEETKQMIADSVLRMCDQGVFIDSINALRLKLNQEHSRSFKRYHVLQTVRKDLGMRYRKVKPICLTANSRQNLIMRQQFALAFLKIDLSKKIILNVDETWLGMSDFRRRKWARPNTTNSIAQLQVVPRISMIAALDTNGQVFYSLIQANNNSEVMEVFFIHLVQVLDQQRPGWRKNHVIMMDNAPYHKSNDTLRLLENLRIPIIFTGPHSYDASPVELLFAAFKSEDINTRHVPTGKK